MYNSDTLKRRYDDSTKNGNMFAFFIVLIFHAMLFLGLRESCFYRLYPPPPPKGIELVFERELPRGPRKKPIQNPVENPPVVNKPGNSAPKSAPVAKIKQSAKPQTQPDTKLSAPVVKIKQSAKPQTQPDAKPSDLPQTQPNTKHSDLPQTQPDAKHSDLPQTQPNAKPSDLPKHGDVEKPAEPTINPRALFQRSADGNNRSNSPSDNKRLPGIGSENITTRTVHTPLGPDRQMITAKLSGRYVGSLPSPAYEIQSQGTVVVEITVDRDGKVIKATATAKGSTTQDVRLWKAAEDAARKAQFSAKNDAPPFQTGTITYVFTLI